MTTALVLSIVSFLLSGFVLMYYFVSFRKHMNEVEYPYEAEERMLELLGKFKHVAAIKLEMLEKKIEELKELTKEANDIYASLNVLLADVAKIKDEIMDNIENEVPSKQDNENKIKESDDQLSNIALNNETKEKKEKEEENTTENYEYIPKSESEVSEPESTESLERRILRLNEEGLEDLDIARKLGIGVGEVKLIIELFKGQIRE